MTNPEKYITRPEDNLIGFFARFNMFEKDQELVKKYLWGENGLTNKLITIKWSEYGEDFHLILFEINVKPIPYLRQHLREIGNYRRKENSIGIPLIIDEDNFFNLNEFDREIFFRKTILQKLQLLEEKVKRNKLDLKIKELIQEVDRLLTKSKAYS
jgi:hypothetical protein